ncbi:hypothetical protein TNCV_3844341 [Trichonephila clavipes]|nr:hypothetical protein TNCV_3844341 [Trichonephila clavipes]
MSRSSYFCPQKIILTYPKSLHPYFSLLARGTSQSSSRPQYPFDRKESKVQYFIKVSDYVRKQTGREKRHFARVAVDTCHVSYVALVPLKTGRPIHVKSVEAQSPAIDVAWKFGGGVLERSGALRVTWPRFKITRSVIACSQIDLGIRVGEKRRCPPPSFFGVIPVIGSSFRYRI